MIDDESPDQCPIICDEYVKLDDRIKVIHKKNGGAASARNNGLDIASGEYIGFVDSDDYVEDAYISKLVKNLEENKADISVCAFSNIYKDRQETVEIEKVGNYSEIEFLERFLWDWKCGLIWNKLFKAELIQNVRFSEGHVIDDEFFTYKIVINANKIYVENEPLYFYRMRKSSVMNDGRQKQMLLDRMQYLQERFEIVTEKYPELYNCYLENFVDNLICFRREAVRYAEVYKLVRNLYRKYLFKVLFSKINIKLKYSFFISLFPKFLRSNQSCNKENVNTFFE